MRRATSAIAFDHWGTTHVARPWGEVTRWQLFDLPFADTEGRRNDRLVGHEDLQRAVYRALGGFRREGRGQSAHASSRSERQRQIHVSPPA